MMSERNFQMRLTCGYTEPENTVEHLNVEVLDEGTWKKFDLNTMTPGFDIFIYALFTCQHMYFRVNAAG